MACAVLLMARGSIPALSQRYQKVRIVEIWEKTRHGNTACWASSHKIGAKHVASFSTVSMRLDDR
jgi:hypothetical protein